MEWDRITLADLDAAMNAWVDTVPEYRTYLLFWDDILLLSSGSSVGSQSFRRAVSGPVREAIHHLLCHAIVGA